MAELAVQSMSTSGLEVAFAAADVAGDTFKNDGKIFIRVKNDDVSDKTVTIDSPIQCNQGGTHNIDVIVTAGEQRDVGPFLRNRFNNDTGRVSITYSAVTSLTVAAIAI